MGQVNAQNTFFNVISHQMSRKKNESNHFYIERISPVLGEGTLKPSYFL